MWLLTSKTSKIVSIATIVASLAFSIVPGGAATATPSVTLPSTSEISSQDSGSGTRDVIVQLPDEARVELSNLLTEWQIEADFTYANVFTGFAATITPSQIQTIENSFPSAIISDQVDYSIDATQSGATWGISSLDGTALPPDSFYTYPDSAGTGVTVYVLDTGQPPANSSEWGSRLLSGVNFIPNETDPADCEGHGTHVAGTVASATYGVAKLATIRALRVLNCTGRGSTAGIIAAIDWAIGNNPDGKRAVLNMSLGGVAINPDPAMDSAVARAVADGIFVVAAAGNEGRFGVEACFISPARSPEAFTVGAVDIANNEADFSNNGTCVDMHAPGVGIVSLALPGEEPTLSGTSMAAPHAAGAAAIYFSLNPTATVAQAKTALISYAEKGEINLRNSSTTSNNLLDIAEMSGLTNSNPPTVAFSGGTSNTVPTSSATVTATSGTWSSAIPPTVTRQWLQCNSAIISAADTVPNHCVEIFGATSGTLLLDISRIGKHISVMETATSGSRSATKVSVTVGPVTQAVQNTLAPVVSGTLQVGQTASVNNGSWLGSPNRFEYEWYVCSGLANAASDTIPAGCAQINGQASSSMIISASQVGKRILASVAAGTDGSTWVTKFSASSDSVTSSLSASTPPQLSFTQAGADAKPRANGPANSVFTTTNGVWVGGTASSFSYEWFRCDSEHTASSVLGESCTQIANQTNQTYTAGADDVGKFIASSVTASGGETAVHHSATSPQVGHPPRNTVSPSVSGDSRVGQTLSAQAGTWIGSPTVSHTYKWYSCSVAASAGVNPPAGCNLIPGATSSTYVIPPTLNGSRIVLQVGGTNASNGVSNPVFASSASTSIVTQVPTNSSAPAVSVVTGFPTGANSAPTVRATSTSTKYSLTTGTWTGNATIAYAYKWYSCDASAVAGSTLPDNCEQIVGATTNQFQVEVDQVTKHIIGEVIATNSVGTSSRFSASQGPVTRVPVATVEPGIDPDVRETVGNPITASAGTWAGSPTPNLAYQWFSCTRQVTSVVSTLPTGCTTITGATALTFTPTTAQFGAAPNPKFLTLRVTATNTATGTAPTTNNAPVTRFTVSNQAVAAAPVLTATNRTSSEVLRASTTTPANSVITVEVGLWPTGVSTATGYTYQWLACDTASAGVDTAPAGCSEIAGATSRTFSVTSAQEGKHVMAKVTYSSPTVTARSWWTRSAGAVQTAVSNSQVPTVSNDGEPNAVSVGRTLTANNGTWAGTAPIRYSHQWFSCSAAVASASSAIPTSCTAITAATASTFQITSAQTGRFLVAGVGAINDISPAVVWRYTASTTQALASPQATANPVLSSSSNTTNGRPRVGSTLTVTRGTWTGLPVPTSTYHWYACDSAVTAAVSTKPENCEEIPGSLSRTTFVIANAQSGNFVTAEVRTTNSVGTSSRWAASTRAVVSGALFDSDPAISGTATVGSTLTAVANSSTQSEITATSYQWLRCNSAVAASNTQNAACTLITGATASTYLLVAADSGRFTSVRVTLTNDSGASVRFGASTQGTTMAPSNTTAPAPTFSTATNPRVDGTATASTGTWAGFPVPTYEYTWVHCTAPVTTKSASLPAGCEVVSDPSDSRTYPIGQSAHSKYLMVKITATNAIGPNAEDIRTSTIWSPTTTQVYELPSFENGPTVSGTPKIGETLTANTLEIRGFPAPNVAYAWFRCNSKVANISISTTVPAGCTAISGQTRQTFQLTAADVGRFVTPRVSITNSIGNSVGFSVSTDQISSPPSFTSNPVISGNPIVGQTLVASSGVSGTPSPTVSYDWFACPSARPVLDLVASDCVLLSEAATNSYLITLEADTKFVVAKATLTNGVEPAATRVSASTAVIKRSPTVISPSTIDPQVAEVSKPIVGTRGTWDATPTLQLANAWYSCAAEVPDATTQLPAGCTVITGQVALSFTPTVAQERRFIVFAVTATNGTTPLTSFSKSTDAVGRAPIYQSGMLATPTAANDGSDGSPRVGGTVDAVPGTWIGFPTPTFEYQWFSCTTVRTAVSSSPASNCLDIPGATASMLTVTQDMVGNFLGYKITGKNIFQPDDSRYSPTTVRAVTSDPVLDSTQIVTGYPHVGAIIESTEGSWLGTPAPTRTIRWWSCASRILESTTVNPASTNDCVQLSTTGRTLRITADLLNRFVSSAVTASNVAASVTNWSESLSRVTRGAINMTAPTLSTSSPPRADSPITVARGTWQGEPALTNDSFTYRWYSCAAVTQSSSTLANDCDLLDAPSSVTYTPSESDGGRYILAGVTGSNSAGESTHFSASTAKVLIRPRITSAPEIEGRAFVGEAMTIGTGIWSALPASDYAYQWFLCSSEITTAPSALPDGCVLVTGATTNRFTPTINNLDRFALGRVTARNTAGQGEAWSRSSTAIVSGPVNSAPPSVTVLNSVLSKAVAPTSSLSTNGGSWLGNPTSTDYQWLRCDSPVTAASRTAPALNANCSQVLDPEDSTIGKTQELELSETDRGKYMMVQVTASNALDTTSHWSATSAQVNMRSRNADAPVVTGPAFIENTVSATGDTWVGFPENPTKIYQWVHCDRSDLEIASPLPSGCTLLTSQTSSSLKVGSALAGRFLYVGVSANNGFGASVVAWSDSSDAVVSGPVNISAPVISGVPASGAPHHPGKPPLSSNDGTWIGSPAPTISYQWYRCPATAPAPVDALPSGCAAIIGATENQRLIDANDPGFAIVMGVTGTNTHGSMTKFTRSTSLVTERVNLQTSPVLTGAPKVGAQLSTTSGTWRGSPTPSIRHLWYSCAARIANPVTTSAAPVAPSGCTAISTGNLPSFTLSLSQDQRFIVYAATRSNTADGVTATVTAYSASTERVTEDPSLNSKPVLRAPAGSATTGSPEVGTTWSASVSWRTQRTPPVVTYQWYQCDEQLSNSGRITQPSTLIDEWINENPETGAPAKCRAIDGATASSYTIAVEDRNKFITFSTTGVQASRPDERITEWANSTAAVLYVPVATTLPTVTGLRYAPQVLTADPGVWDGSPTPVFSYQWFRCTSAVPNTVTTLPAGCSSISGQTSQTYTQNTLSDQGAFLTVRVLGASSDTARTSYWVSVTADEATARIPANDKAPVVRLAPNGLNKMFVGERLESTGDAWIAVPSFTRTFQWYACTSTVTIASNSQPANCLAIEGATSSEYSLSQSDADNRHKLLVGVTAENIAGSTTKFSASTTTDVTKPVENTVPSSITTGGDNLVPTQVVATPGTWAKPNAQLRVTYTWLHCSQEITSTLSFAPNHCSKARVDSVNSISNLELNEGTLHSGRYIALMESVSELPSGNRLATRVSPSTAYISEAPKLWRSLNVYQNPGVPLKMRKDVASDGNPGNWLPVQPSPKTQTSWRGSPVGDISAAWYRCDTKQQELVENLSAGSALPAGCEWISGATSTSYTPDSADLLKYLGMELTATNSVGTSIVRTASSNRVTDDVKNTTPPALGGDRTVGGVITVQNGTWTGTPTPTLSRKWFHCPTSRDQGAPVTGCTEIVGQTDSTLALGPSMAGRFIVAQVTGQNYAYGETDEVVSLPVTTASSLQILEVPVSLSRPTLSGFANVGNTLTIVAGNWRGTEAPTFSHRWIVCDSDPGNDDFGNSLPEDCAVTPGSLSSLLLSSSQSAKFIIGQHIATNSSGTRYASTVASSQVTEAPRNLSEPTVSLERTSGETITATEGTWAGFPAPTFTYQWYSCPSQSTTPSQAFTGCTALGSASASKTLLLQNSHAGRFIRVEEIASNRVNGSTAPTRQTKGSISSEPIRTLPAFASTPTISGNNHVGQTLTANAGSVSGFETPTLSYSWYGCDSRVSTPVSEAEGCTLLSSASATNTYRLTEAAAGKFVIALVTATNPAGSVSKSSVSASTAVSMTPVMSEAPVATVSIANQGNRVSVTSGQWRGFPNPTYTYQWFRCTAESAGGTETTPSGCTLITNAIQSSYVLTATDASRFIVARVRATIPAAAALDNSTDAFSNSQGPVASQPLFSASPTVSGVQHVGQQLSVSATMTGFPTPTQSFAWYHCTNAVTAPVAIEPSGCEQIPGTASTLTIPESASGRFVIAVVTGQNSWTTSPGNSATTRSTTSSVRVSEKPVNTTAPVISGTPAQGSQLSVISSGTNTPGTWRGFPAPSYTYQWFSCNTAKLVPGDTVASDCTLVTGQTGSTFVPRAIDGEKYIVARVRATSAVNLSGASVTDIFTASTAEISSAPVVTVGPTVTGTMHVGSVLRSTATVTGIPTPSVSIAWYSCSASVASALTAIPSTCTVIPEQTDSQLTLPASAAGRFVISAVTATNSWTAVPGNSPVVRTSTSTARVTQTPVNTVAPTHSSTSLEVGAVLSTNNGQWSSFPANPTFLYSWFRCAEEQNLSGNLTDGCEQITLLASQSSYRLTAADFGKYVVARVTATISPLAAGLDRSTDAYSPSRGVIVDAQAQRLNSGQVNRVAGFLGVSVK